MIQFIYLKHRNQIINYMDFFTINMINNIKDTNKTEKNQKLLINGLQSLDYWSHSRRLRVIRPFIKRNQKWLTIGEVVLFKDKPSYEILDKLSNINWKYKELSINPYICGYAK